MGPVWFFDLDNTLHDASWRIFGMLDKTINAYIGAQLKIEESDANHLRRNYWLRYGATISGLVRHHAIRLEHYVEETHQFIHDDDILQWTRSEGALSASLARLPGRKILLTNAPARYARRVLSGLKIARHFDKTISIEDMQYHGQLRPKPSRALLRRLTAAEGIASSQAILVEDTLANLKSARAEGWRTVHVASFPNKEGKARISRASFVDLQVKSIAQLAQRHRLVYPDAQR